MPIKIPDFAEKLDAETLPRSPLEILNEVAELLPASTRGLVEAYVSTINPGGATFRYTFFLVVPSLDNYTDPLFYAWHTSGLYPVTVLPTGTHQDIITKVGQQEIVCKNAEAFEDTVSRIFASDWAQERIFSMMELALTSSGQRGRNI